MSPGILKLRGGGKANYMPFRGVSNGWEGQGSQNQGLRRRGGIFLEHKGFIICTQGRYGTSSYRKDNVLGKNCIGLCLFLHCSIRVSHSEVVFSSVSSFKDFFFCLLLSRIAFISRGGGEKGVTTLSFKQKPTSFLPFAMRGDF